MMTSNNMPAAEPRDALDLDAVQARADAASVGPWEAYPAPRSPDHFSQICIPDSMHPTAYRKDAEFIAHARTDVPALIGRIRELEAAAASVIPADARPYETQTLALDALPVHTLVSYRDHDGELHTLEKTEDWVGSESVWWETTARQSASTYNLVRNEVDYTIVRMGAGS